MIVLPVFPSLAALVLLLGGIFPSFAQSRPALPASDPAKGELRVVTYNILGGRGTDNARDIGRVAEVLRVLHPDLIALQEVDVLTRRNGGVDIPAELAKRLGLEVHFAPAFSFDGGHYGVAVLSALPVRDRRAHTLPTNHGREVRAVAAMEVEWRDRRLTFWGTHLDHHADNSTRRMQIADLARLAGDGTTPALLAGDLNMEPDFPEFADLTRHWTLHWSDARAQPTWPSDKPAQRIDHVLARGPLKWVVQRSLTGDQLFADDAAWRDLLRKTSDHLPVVVELKQEVDRP